MSQLGNHILLGVTGGIAAYKAAYLTRLLTEKGYEVRVVMTEAAQQFVSALTFQALSGYPVATSLLDADAEAGMGHIELARWADAILVAPATADFMAKIAHGLAGDLLGNIVLASAAPLYLVPAMNQQMWRNQATQRNAQLLTERGIKLLGPVEGLQACGDTGLGRMLEPEDIVKVLQQDLKQLSDQSMSHASVAINGLNPLVLNGKIVVITAGPTQEVIDPVRYISNHSSGKMGYALAQACQQAGAKVYLVSGPTSIAEPENVKMIRVATAEEMLSVVMTQVQQECDIFIATAAVADYKVAEPSDKKIKKNDEEIVLKLIKNPDILFNVANLPHPPFTVGFAAETHGHHEHARQKLIRKKLDMLAMNDVSDATIGFQSEQNALQVYYAPKYHKPEQTLAKAPKTEIAASLAALIAQCYLEQQANSLTK